MKRFVLFIFGIFICFGAWAETTNQNWIVDGETYYTSTCTVGESVDLPPTPTKYGYDFDGWLEIFYRGTFDNFEKVPSTGTINYTKDSYNSRTPKENDYIIITNASDYSGTVCFISDGTTLYWNVEGVRGNSLISNISSVARNVGERGSVGFRKTSILYLYIYEANHYKSTPSASTYLTQYSLGNYSAGFSQIIYTDPIDPVKYSGTWRFKYKGIWSSDGKCGWVPEKRLD